jgi:nicotinamidase-related amidase
MDLQKGILACDVTQALPVRVRDHIASIGEHYRAVFFSVFKNEPESLFYTRHGYQGCVGPPDTDVADQLADLAHESNVFYRAGFSAFANPELLAALRKYRISELDVVGVDTDVCVLATVLDAFQHGIMPAVIPELCASSSGPEAHQSAIEFITRNVVQG